MFTRYSQTVSVCCLVLNRWFTLGLSELHVETSCLLLPRLTRALTLNQNQHILISIGNNHHSQKIGHEQ